MDGSAFFGDLVVEVEQVPILVYLSIQCNTITTIIFLMMTYDKSAAKSANFNVLPLKMPLVQSILYFWP